MRPLRSAPSPSDSRPTSSTCKVCALLVMRRSLAEQISTGSTPEAQPENWLMNGMRIAKAGQAGKSKTTRLFSPFPARCELCRLALQGQVASAPFGAGKFAATVGGQRRDKPPFARDLPGGQFGHQELPQGLSAHAVFNRQTSHDGFAPFHVRAVRAKGQAFAHFGMLRQNFLNGLR